MTKYFLIILFLFASVSFLLNVRLSDALVQDVSIIEHHLEESLQSFAKSFQIMTNPQPQDDPQLLLLPPSDAEDGDDDDDGNNKENNSNNNDNKDNNDKDNNNNDKDNTINPPHAHRVSGLNCDKWGGPSEEDAKEMVYWEDIPSDNQHMSPFHWKKQKTQQPPKQQRSMEQFMTFEPDGGGWNNIRMAMETVLGMAFAMGRTLVLPPHQKMYLLTKEEKGKQRSQFSFDHFFHMESISNEHVGLDIITMSEFLELAKNGGLVSNGQAIFPPNNRTDYDGASREEMDVLKKWLRTASTLMVWNPEDCVAAFPQSDSPADMQALVDLKEHIETNGGGFPKFDAYVGKPNPVDASAEERLKENWAERKELCLYTPELQQTAWVHFPYGGEYKSRLLVHFYGFLFFQDWKHDLWMKRFVRDHVRYIDEIQCAAARVVQALRQRVKERTSGKSSDFDTMHVRRGDFQYKVTRAEANDIYEMTSKQIPDNTTVYIATDERNKAFFRPLQDKYDVVFLDDLIKAGILEGVNTNYYGMIDQLVASRGRIFFGCWFSTFTGYINRLRGYHADEEETPGYEQGIVPSYYYALKDRYLHMQTFYPVKKSFYAREFPTSWRLIDTGVDDMK